MAEEHNHTFETTEVEDRGLLDFVSKKEEKADEEVLLDGVKNLHIKEDNLEDEKKHSLLDKLHRSNGSLSDEGEADEEEKGLKEKLNGDYKAEEDTVVVTQEAVNVEEPDDSTIVVEKVVTGAVVEIPTELEEEKEECLEEMMEKLKEHKKILEEGAVESIAPEVKEGAIESTTPPPPALAEEEEECLEEMMEKLQEHKKTLEEGAVETIAPEVKEGAIESTAPPLPALAVEPKVEEEECLDETMKKLQEHKKTPEEGAVESIAPPPLAPVGEPEVEKKSFLAKIKEKLPGYHKSGGEQGEKAAAASE